MPPAALDFFLHSSGSSLRSCLCFSHSSMMITTALNRLAEHFIPSSMKGLYFPPELNVSLTALEFHPVSTFPALRLFKLLPHLNQLTSACQRGLKESLDLMLTASFGVFKWVWGWSVTFFFFK